MPVTTLFFDVGGVVLSNGWDRVSRRKLVTRFGMDYDEFRDRHDFVVHDFETGRIDLHEYLRRTVFHAPRHFTEEEFVAAMKAESRPRPDTLALLEELGAAGIFLVTLNNESRALNDHRIATFELRRYFSAFISSCYVGYKKPEPQIFRLAFEITQAHPDETRFIDDRELNIECAADEGLAGILFESAAQLRAELVAHGVLG